MNEQQQILSILNSIQEQVAALREEVNRRESEKEERRRKKERKNKIKKEKGNKNKNKINKEKENKNNQSKSKNHPNAQEPPRKRRRLSSQSSSSPLIETRGRKSNLWHAARQSMKLDQFFAPLPKGEVPQPHFRGVARRRKRKRKRDQDNTNTNAKEETFLTPQDIEAINKILGTPPPSSEEDSGDATLSPLANPSMELKNFPAEEDWMNMDIGEEEVKNLLEYYLSHPDEL